MESSLSNRKTYAIQEIPNGYIFDTDNGERYFVSFSGASDAVESDAPFANDVFTFNFQRISESWEQRNKGGGIDEAVKNTIGLFLENHFVDFPQSVLIAFYSDKSARVEGKLLAKYTEGQLSTFRSKMAQERKKRFDKWYQDLTGFSHQPTVLKREVNLYGGAMDCVCLYRKDNPHLVEIGQVITFNEIQKVLWENI